MTRPQSDENRLFRFVVLAILLLIFITVATIKIWELRGAAERVGVLHTLGSLRSAVGIKMGQVVISDGMAALHPLHHSNPMRLWSPPPVNYLGEFHSNEAPHSPGDWYFDLDRRQLVYRVRFPEYFTSDNPLQPDLARYQLRLNYRDANGNGLFDAGSEQVTDIALEAVDHYTWSLEPIPDETDQ